MRPRASVCVCVFAMGTRACSPDRTRNSPTGAGHGGLCSAESCGHSWVRPRSLCPAREPRASPTRACRLRERSARDRAPGRAPDPAAPGRGHPGIPKIGSGSGGSSGSRSGAASEPAREAPPSRPFPGKREPELVCFV